MKQSFEEALGRSGAKLKWSGLGIATVTLGFPAYALYLFWPSQKKEYSRIRI